MKELLHYLITKIIDDPESVSIESIEDGDEVTLNVDIPEEFRGIIIGRGGMNIKSLRNIIGIIARREGKRVYIKILD
jgi:uncharacterized protein